MTRTATAVREGRFWVVDVPGVGATQGRSIREARAMAADLVEAMTGQAEDVEVHFKLPDDVRVAVDHARATTVEAKRLASVAADEYRQAVRDLVVDRGMSKADVAALLNVSQQRVSQLAP
ncbi:MAG: hypothetical protein H7323_05605 [Frankiales bacterium]|nr:hypothetical protein [Frankiales bacterium]